MFIIKTHYSLLLSLLLLAACSQQKTGRTEAVSKAGLASNRQEMPQLRDLIDHLGLQGSVLIYDVEGNIYHSNDFGWADSRHLPASTFKIPNAMIMLESGIMASDTASIKWLGDERMFKSWEQDMTLKQAFHRSCLPCYQQMTRQLGFKQMQQFTGKLIGYGELLYDSTTYDRFWVEGSSGISQMEQIEFLQRLYQEKLPFSERTYQLTKRMIVAQSNAHYRLSAKTGWSIVGDQNNGWYVGFLEADNLLYYFATNLTPKEKFDMSRFSKIRKELTFSAFRYLRIAKKDWEEFQ